MTNLWIKVAQSWRNKLVVDSDKVMKTIDKSLDDAKKVIDISKPVPSFLDAVMAEDDDDDDW